MSIRVVAQGTVLAPVAVWRIDLDADDGWVDERVLDADESERAGRFAFEKLARRYRRAHAALRQLLALRIGAEPAHLRFVHGPHGKPYLAGLGDSLTFNLSDSDDVALIALAPEGEIGVDVERLRAVSDARELAVDHFCAREAAWLAGAGSDSQRDRRFLRTWTRKEACLKAVGSGLSIPASSFDACLGDDRPTSADWQPVAIDTPQGCATVEVIEIDAGAEYVAALARMSGRMEAVA